MSSRPPLHTGLGCFATLLAMIPVKIAQAAGLTESQAFQLGGVVLVILAVIAFKLHRTPWAQARGFRLEPMPERFELSEFFRYFAMFAVVELVFVTGVWIALSYALGPQGG